MQFRMKEKEKEEQKVEATPKQQEKMTVYVGRLGADSQQLTLPADTTLGEVVKQCKLERMEVRVNRQNVSMSTKLKEGDLIVAVPDAINFIVAIAA